MSKATVDQPGKTESPDRRCGDHLQKNLHLHSVSPTRARVIRPISRANDARCNSHFEHVTNSCGRRTSIQSFIKDKFRRIDRVSRASVNSVEFSFKNLSRFKTHDYKSQDQKHGQTDLNYNLDNFYLQNQNNDLFANNSVKPAKISDLMTTTDFDFSISDETGKRLKPLQTKADTKTGIQFSIASIDVSATEKKSVKKTPRPKKQTRKISTKSTQLTRSKTKKEAVESKTLKELSELEKAIDQVFEDDENLIAPFTKSDTVNKEDKPQKHKITLIRVPEIREDLANTNTGLKIDFDESYLDSEEKESSAETEKQSASKSDTAINRINIPPVITEAISFDELIRPEIATVSIRFADYVKTENPENVEEIAISPTVSTGKIAEKSKKVNIEFLRSSDDLRPQMKRPDLAKETAREKLGWSLDVDAAVRDLMGNLGTFDDTNFEYVVSAWRKGYKSFFNSPLDEIHCPYIWVSEHVMNASNADIKMEYVSIFGVDLSGRKRLLSFKVKDTDDNDFWRNLLGDLEKRGLTNPRLFIAACDSVLWDNLAVIFPRAERQYCWSSLILKIKQKMSVDSYKIARKYLDNIRKAENIEEAFDRIEVFKSAFGDKYPVAVSEILKYRRRLFTFMKYPIKHRDSVKSVAFVTRHFPPENLMSAVLKSEIFRPLSVYMLFNYIVRFEKNWIRLESRRLLRKVQRGKRFDIVKPARMKSRLKLKKAGTRHFANVIGKLNTLMTPLRTFVNSSQLIAAVIKMKKSFKTISILEKLKLNRTKTPPEKNALADNLSNQRQQHRSVDLAQTAGYSPIPRASMKKRWSLRRGLESTKPSRPLSGLERELINDLNLEKKAFSS